MNIFAWMQTYPDFSTTEQTIAQYLIENGHRCANLNAETIMSECYVSRAALYRFCTRCGFSGLRALLLQMNADAVKWNQQTAALDFSYPFTEQDDLLTVASSLQKDYSQSILMAQSLLVQKDLEKAIQAMRKASRIVVFTSASNIPAAQSFRFQMAEINKTVLVPVDEYEQRLQAAQCGPDDFPIVITMAARGWNAPFLIRHFQKTERPWLLISSRTLALAPSDTAYRLFLPNEEDHAARISSFSTRASLNWLLDVLFAAYFQLDYQANQLCKTNAYNIIGSKGR